MKTCTLLIPFLFLAACGGGGGGGGGDARPRPGPITPPPDPTAPSIVNCGVLAACADATSARIDVRLPGTGFEAALFQATSAGAVYAAAPVVAPLTSGVVLRTGLTTGDDVFFGLGVRAVGGTTFAPAGSVVRVHCDAPIFVDAAANPAVADGLSPATAFPNLQDALLVAGSRNGGNVWVRDGEYRSGPYALGPGVHCAGGFDATFALASRDVGAGRTRLLASAGLQMVDVICGGSDASLDGMSLDGGGTVVEGVDVTDSDVELRSLVVRGFVDRGVRAKVTAPTPNRSLLLVACNSSANGADGVSSAGPIDVTLDLSQFEANGNEGADVDDLQAPDGGAVSLRATGCRFFGNVFEGLDIDLAAAPLATGSGTFDVLVENCSFERNGLDGLLVDQEHEAFPGFRATVVVRGCSARGNRGAGVRLDADAAGTYHVDRLRGTANRGAGLSVTSETNAGEVFVTASWLAGNQGPGAHASLGNKVLVLSHCALAGNLGGGVASELVTSSAANCVFLRQPQPLRGVVGAGNVVTEDVATFTAAPRRWLVATATTNTSVTVASAEDAAIGDRVTATDDGRRLVLLSLAGTVLGLDQAPTTFPLPGMLALWSTDVVVEDLRLGTGSAAASAGIAAAGSTAPDCGPFGCAAGGAPGRREPFAPAALRIVATSPSLADGLQATDPLTVRFDRPLAAASVTADRVVVERNGTVVAAGTVLTGDTLTVNPPVGGWSGTLVVKLLPGIAAQDGSPLAAATLLAPRLR